jgi:hypothetical protein
LGDVLAGAITLALIRLTGQPNLPAEPCYNPRTRIALYVEVALWYRPRARLGILWNHFLSAGLDAAYPHPFRNLMSRISSFLLGMVTGGAVLHAATAYHLVRASDGFHVVAKQPARLSETYVDVRKFTMADWASRPQLASALVQANQAHLLGDSTASSIQSGVNGLLPVLRK